MLKKSLSFAILILFIIGCSEKAEDESPAKGQIGVYSKKLEDCKESVANKKLQQKEIVKQQIFERGYKAEPDDIVLGDSSANLVFVEYFSPTCPHCVNYHKNIFPLIKENFVDTGKIQYIMREFIGNKQDLDATILARCAKDQDMYFKFIDIILNKQDNWMYSKNYREILTNIGTMGGISAEQYAKCLNDESQIRNLIENTKLAAKDQRFIGTPSFFINGKIFTKPYTVEELSQAINAALGSDEKK
jgi:protein-disulfide isomerase